MLAEAAVNSLKAAQLFFHNSIHVLAEEDSGFRPSDGMYTVAQHVAHAAHTVTWFAEGAFSATGPIWDEGVMDAHNALLERSTSLRESLKMFDSAIDEAVQLFAGRSDEEMMATLPAQSVMGPAPRLSCMDGLRDHTAHHRGALTVYARALGKTPLIPYMPPPSEDD